MTPRPLRILVAEDSALFVAVLQDLIGGEPDMEIIGVADNGADAVDMCQELEPDLVLMDIRMPKMDGLAATEAIMANHPTPIFVVTSDPYQGGVDLSFKALSAGALDLMPKPTAFPWPEHERAPFLRKIRLLAQIPVVRHPRGNLRRKRVSLHGTRQPAAEEAAVVGVIASTGGPKALARLFGALPPDFPAPILVVQHIIRGFSEHLAGWLNANSDLRVQEAMHGLKAAPGNVYVAPADTHLEIASGRFLELNEGPPVGGHCPSGDLLLESIARHAGSRGVGIIMSGMGSDGTAGLAAMHRSGGTTIVQDRDSSVVYGMPQSAIDLGVVGDVVMLDEMAAHLNRAVRRIHQGDA